MLGAHTLLDKRLHNLSFMVPVFSVNETCPPLYSFTLTFKSSTNFVYSLYI